VLKYDGGSTVAGRFWAGDEYDGLNTIALDGDGGIWAAGTTASHGEGGADVLILKYDSSLNLLMQKTWGTEAGENAYGIEIDGSNVLIAGLAHDVEAGSGDESLLLLSYSTSGLLNGSQAWGGGGSSATRMIAGGSGTLLFAGIAPNAYGNWQQISGAQTETSGIQETMSCEVVDIIGVESEVAGTQAAPPGTLNEGGGELDALVVKYTP
jgi:hypothetical protein